MHVIMWKWLSVLRTAEEYDKAVDLLDNLIDEVGEDGTHPLASFTQALDVLIEQYEAEHIPERAEVS